MRCAHQLARSESGPASRQALTSMTRSKQKRNRRGEPRRQCIEVSEETVRRKRDLLWEEDLHAPVLRLAHTIRRRHAQVVLAAADDGHVAAGNAERCQSI